MILWSAVHCNIERFQESEEVCTEGTRLKTNVGWLCTSGLYCEQIQFSSDSMDILGIIHNYESNELIILNDKKMRIKKNNDLSLYQHFMCFLCVFFLI